jgi:hypothetical protein
VLFFGMAGAGKITCALELAWRHEPAFQALAWWRAPDADRDVTGSLNNFAAAMEAQLEGFEMVSALASRQALERFAPRLRRLLEERAVLLVLDNLESLLTAQGGWRDPNWALLVEALVDHQGESRVVMTARVHLQGLPAVVMVEPVHALGLDEALLLARELPNLGRILYRDQDPAAAAPPGGDEATRGWVLVRRTLELIQGHPKLLELADAQAHDPAALAGRLAEADQATTAGDRGQLDAFFAEGETILGEAHFVRVLADWTGHAVRALPEGPRLLFGVLCCLEPLDRAQNILEVAWPGIWRALGRPGAPPGLDDTLAALAANGLVAIDRRGKDAPTRYPIHPGGRRGGPRPGRRRRPARCRPVLRHHLAGHVPHLSGCGDRGAR